MHRSSWALELLVLVGLIGVATTAHAHEIGTSVLDVAIVRGSEGLAVDVSLGVHAHLVDLAAGSDEDQDGALTQGEIDHTLQSFEAYVVARLDVLADGKKCAGTLAEAHPTRRGGAQVRVHYRCSGAAAAVVESAR